MLVWLCSPYKCVRQFSFGLKFRTFHVDLSKNNPSDPLIGTHVFLCLYLTSDVQPRDNVWEQMCECRTFWAPGWFILQYISVAHVRTGSCPWEYWLKEAITMQSVKPLLSLGILLHEGAELQPSFVCQQDLPFSSFLYFCPVRFFPFFFSLPLHFYLSNNQ